MDTHRSQWIGRRVRTARQLYAGECGAGYAEATMILCAAISALAAEIWPGKRKDRARFVQMHVEFLPAEFHATKLSIPLLIGGLVQKSLRTEAETIQNQFLRFDPSRALTGEEVDQAEKEILALWPTLSTNFLRQFSYAKLLYEEVRSAYVHEYSTGVRADAWPTTLQTNASISYGNWVNEPIRHIHFHIEWVIGVVTAVAKSIDSSSSMFPRRDPVTWWLDGNAS
jgi:hypothetical protein